MAVRLMMALASSDVRLRSAWARMAGILPGKTGPEPPPAVPFPLLKVERTFNYAMLARGIGSDESDQTWQGGNTRPAGPDAGSGDGNGGSRCRQYPREPRTERGRRTQRAILDAAAAEFGEKGFHESSIVSITIRAGVALGSFYTYFELKEALFKALVADMSGRVRDVAPVLQGHSGGAVEAEGAALHAFLDFARHNKEIYRIIDEAEFVAPQDWRAHYLTTAARAS